MTVVFILDRLSGVEQVTGLAGTGQPLATVRQTDADRRISRSFQMNDIWNSVLK
jgi:hypothetical protein